MKSKKTFVKCSTFKIIFSDRERNSKGGGGSGGDDHHAGWNDDDDDKDNDLMMMMMMTLKEISATWYNWNIQIK